MLRIKEDKMNELENYFIKLNILDGEECIQNNVYCCVHPNDIEYIENNCIENYNVQFFINKLNKISFCTYPEQRDTNFILDKVYDLTKADLVERI